MYIHLDNHIQRLYDRAKMRARLCGAGNGIRRCWSCAEREKGTKNHDALPLSVGKPHAIAPHCARLGYRTCGAGRASLTVFLRAERVPRRPANCVGRATTSGSLHTCNPLAWLWP